MPYPAYSFRLGTATTVADNTPQTVYTVPTGFVVILRDWVWSQTGTGSCRGRLTATGVNGNLDLTDVLPQHGQVARSERHVVMVAGDQLVMRAQNTTLPIILSFTAWGYKLDAL